MIVAKSIFRLADCVEVVSRVQHRIPKVFECAAVKLVRSAPCNDAYYRAGISPILRFEIRQNVQFLDGVLGKYRPRHAKYSALIDCRQVPVAVIHIRAVEKVVVGAAAAAICAEKAVGARRVTAAIRLTCRAWNHDEKLGIVPAIDRQFFNFVVLKRSAERIARRLHYRQRLA